MADRADIVRNSLTRSPSKEKEVRPSKKSMFDELRPVKITTTKDLVKGPNSLNFKRHKNNNENSRDRLSCKSFKHYVSILNLSFSFILESIEITPKIMRDEKIHIGSKNSNIFPNTGIQAYKHADDRFCTESRRSFGSKMSNDYPEVDKFGIARSYGTLNMNNSKLPNRTM